MSKHYNRYTVTAALPYANGPLHIGHIAGAYLPADIYVRSLRQKGKDVAFICGSDEHGAAITIRAQKEGITPQDIIEKYNKQIGDTFKKFGIAFDLFHRTSAPVHHETAQDFFKTLNDNGEFELRESSQYYDEEAKQFLADRYIVGTCPKCGHDAAYGDQCEKCGSSLSPTDLIDPKSQITGNTPVLKTTRHWYLPMNKHEDWLREWINEGTLEGREHHTPSEWKNSVLGQCRSWLDQGLQPRAMTRDLDWGVKVPVEGADGKVLYVWLDAPIGYISATKDWAASQGKNWEDYWKKADTKLVHFIGKDNIVFHCLIFPILLKSHGEFILPDNVPANEFLNLEGAKLSTSRNWAVWLHEYLEDLPNREDELRYVLTSIAPENKDSEFTWKDYQERVNNELVAILGNFINRAVVLTHKYFKGEVPVAGEFTPMEEGIVAEMKAIPLRVEKLIEQYKFKEALIEAMKLARLGNKYLADTEPWKLFKQDPELVKTILNMSLQIAANLAITIDPFLPNTAKKIQNMLGMESLDWNQVGNPELITAYDRLAPAELLFSKVEDKVIEAQIEKLEKTKISQAPVEPQKDETTFDDFQKMDIRVGTIVEAEKMKKAKKLLKLTVDTGIDKRTVVSGIAEFFAPEDIIGKQVSILVNLAPRKIRGIESQGMILMAEDKDGTLSFVSPTSQIAEGGIIR
ncbi:methionine--tRNA ligase [Flammeovirga sp. SJP92]|uniref:methionine--tRNA ligase n=1 Tax=Flammeovirga sp. SJP92 TaxID=1775430 RepID=UPI0007892D00|nr:methionine--tRNA ligase [Flammeovirga sp. SJP92]KXX67908.1 methionine--tRNA ligase [Flammeovirga sp. SJP92]